MFVGRIQMQMFKVRIQMQMFKVRIQMQIQMHYTFYGGIWMRIQMLNIQMRFQMDLYLLTSLTAGSMIIRLTACIRED